MRARLIVSTMCFKESVMVLGETIRLMGKVDGVIESAGGWPVK